MSFVLGGEVCISKIKTMFLVCPYGHGILYSFDEFFFHEGTDDEDRKVMSDAARLYSSALLEGRLLTLDEENMIFSGLEKMAGYDYFQLSVADEITKALRGNTAPGRIRKAWKVLSEAAMRSGGYNMSIRLALDTALREAEIGK